MITFKKLHLSTFLFDSKYGKYLILHNAADCFYQKLFSYVANNIFTRDQNILYMMAEYKPWENLSMNVRN